MKTWAYVICELVYGYPSFRHTFVRASSETDAYYKGHATLRQPAGNGLNDYVFEIPTDRGQMPKGDADAI